MNWGEAIQVVMENRSLFYSQVLDHWRVKKWAGKRMSGFLYDGPSFEEAFTVFLGSHANEPPTRNDDDLKEKAESK